MEEVFHGPLASRLWIREWTHPQRSGDISWLIAINMGDLSEKRKLNAQLTLLVPHDN